MTEYQKQLKDLKYEAASASSQLEHVSNMEAVVSVWFHPMLVVEGTVSAAKVVGIEPSGSTFLLHCPVLDDTVKPGRGHHRGGKGVEMHKVEIILKVP